jgi:hypothetical protein
LFLLLNFFETPIQLPCQLPKKEIFIEINDLIRRRAVIQKREMFFLGQEKFSRLGG